MCCLLVVPFILKGSGGEVVNWQDVRLCFAMLVGFLCLVALPFLWGKPAYKDDPPDDPVW
jgi:hypothetical protein